jgi:hypothetical protein
MKICSNIKTCIHKGKYQETSNFHRKPMTKDGYDYECKDCKTERRKEYWVERKKMEKERFSMFIGS